MVFLRINFIFNIILNLIEKCFADHRVELNPPILFNLHSNFFLFETVVQINMGWFS